MAAYIGRIGVVVVAGILASAGIVLAQAAAGPQIALTLRSSSKDEALVAAARRGDRDAASRALVQGASPNAAERDGTTPLHWAAHHGDAELADVLIRAGADVRVKNRYGMEPIGVAAVTGDPATMRHLLAAGADANAKMPGGEPVLMTAARTGNPDTIRALVAHGADPNARESMRGQTALMWAAAANNLAAMRVLIDAGAEVSARTKPAQAAPPTAAASSTGGSFSQAVQAARYGRSGGATPTFTALLFAAQTAQTDAVRLLVESGADPNEKLSNGMSALVLACMNANWETASVLLDLGADPDASEQGWTALHQIARSRRTNLGFMPTVDTGRVGSLDLVKKLIARGASVNAQMTQDFRDGYRNRLNRIGATPFLLAAKSVDTELMRVLLEAGADPLKPNADGTTPLMAAAGVDIWNPGEDGGSGPDSEPEALEAVKMLAELGGDVTEANRRGETPLHGAAYRGANSIVTFLVERGAKLDTRSAEGWTPWTIANGVFYSLFFKEQRSTADLLEKLMAERGISTAGMEADKTKCFDCARTREELDASGSYRRQYDPKSLKPGNTPTPPSPPEQPRPPRH